MTHDRFDELFADLAAAERGRERHDRAGDYSDYVSEAYADKTLATRLAGAAGEQVELRTPAGAVSGRLHTAGRQWCLLKDATTRRRVLVGLAHVSRVRLHLRSHAPATGVSALSMGAPLRRWASERTAVRAVLADGSEAEGRVDAVGADYVQLRAGGTFDLLPFTALVMVSQLD